MVAVSILLAAVALVAAPACAREPIALRVDVEQPRAFGYRLGDIIERRVIVDLPRGLRLDEASLPKIARPGHAIELRGIDRTSERIDGGERLRLVLRYQLFVSPLQARTFELPAVRLRFDGMPGEQTALVEAWPLAAAPLTPPEASSRTGLGELRPDAPLMLPEPPLRRLVVWATLAALALAVVPHVLLGERWWARRQRPFARAYRDLRRLDLSAGGAPLHAAFRRLHRAFDEAAGRSLFAAGAASFAADGTRWAALRADIGAFFERSRAAFFGNGPPRADDGARLLALARALRDAERGAA
jgi:mxaA protein